jgi:hypothetical protein
VRDEERLQHLKELCEQAEELRKAAEKLCQEITVQIERSRRAHSPHRYERRRIPRLR